MSEQKARGEPRKFQERLGTVKGIVGGVVKAHAGLQGAAVCHARGPDAQHRREVGQHRAQDELRAKAAARVGRSPRDHGVPEKIHGSAQHSTNLARGSRKISYDGAVALARFKIELIRRESLSSRVHLLRFSSRPPLRWAAGQYLVVLRGQSRELTLPYSIASAHDPEHPGELEIVVAVHAGADVIDQLAVGDELEAEGPAGAFRWQADPSPSALLVGVGTGIAPLRALIQEQLARETKTRLLLLAGHRAPEDVLFQDDFVKLAEADARFQFVPTLTSNAAHWVGRRGRVQMQLAEAVRTLGPLDAYVCGRLDMVHEVTSALRALGVPESRIVSEGY